jgi:type VI secretion system secreted protein VgrG
MPTIISQANQPIEVLTPLGKDALLITAFHGEESISRLFHFRIDMIADTKKEIAFDKLLGQKIAIRLNQTGGKPRFFNGICNRISQGEGDADFTAYHMEIVPHFWVLTKRAQCRIFQQMSVPDILKKVLTGLEVNYQLQGTFPARNYCVQYRETDFNFACRLMEDEGIFYFFTHTAETHKMVLANTPPSHPDMPTNNKLDFEKNVGNIWPEDRVLSWQKQQELVSGNFTLWDHKFEMHGRNLEAKKTLPETVQVGKATHKLKAGNADSREIYDYPGTYAQRFDGVNPGGGEQPAEIKKILQENERVVGIRMQEEAVRGVLIHGTSTCRNLVSGHKFTLQKHGGGDGEYLLTGIQHRTTSPIDYRSADAPQYQYVNSVTAIPFAVPFRPQRITPKPFVQGTQTAVVVGPAGEEIFCDKYSRVKVQFPWDREGKFDANSSCWVRVSTLWAGKGWGIVTVPRIGHEVIVAFEEGDPDLPIIMGSVYNADHMPAGEFPKDKMVSGLKSNSTPGGGGFNGMTFNDTKKKEKISLHGQHDMDTVIEHDDMQHVKNDRKITVDGTHTETIKKDTKITISEGTFSHDVAAKTATYHVKGAVSISYDDTETTTVTKAVAETFNDTQTTTVKNKISIASTAADIEISGKTKIVLVSGDSSITLNADGTISISGKDVSVSGTAKVTAGVGNQTLTCDTGKLATAGAAIAASATGKHEITGAVVKIN